MEITKEMMLSAKTYIPMADKMEIADAIANGVVVPVKTAGQNRPGNDVVSLPELYEENAALKIAAMQNAFLAFYFGIEQGEDDEPLEWYDRYASSHVMNQIERFKSDKETKDIAFDMLDDWRDFKKIVDTAIFNRRANMNDPLGRLAASISLLSDPENIAKMTAELSRTVDEFQLKLEEARTASPEEKHE